MNEGKSISGVNNGDDDNRNLNHGYIFDITSMLSGIISNEVIRTEGDDEINICNNCKDKGGECMEYGRDFGTLGEHCAATKIIQYEMNKILGSENVHKEQINEHWDWDDEISARNPEGTLYIGKLDEKRWDLEWNLKIKIYDKSNKSESDDISPYEIIESFPLLRYSEDGKDELIATDLRVLRRYQLLGPKNQIILQELHWEDPYNPWQIKAGFVWRIISWIASRCGLLPQIKGFILMDDYKDDATRDTIFMSPSFGEGNPRPNSILSPYKPQFSVPGFSISGKNGKRIKDQLEKNRIVKADIYSKWKSSQVDSYNVIAQISGENSDTVSIICAHYDCWWNQGAIDEAAETALVLGIAKYMKENQIVPKHTVKFIAFGGEEWGMRGSKDYVKKHLINGDEKVKYVINPGNFGHVDRGYPFMIHSNNKTLRENARIKADEIKEEYGYPLSIDTTDEIGAEDSDVFQNLVEEGIIQFSRWPFKGYHRDGNNHTEGDVITNLDRDLFPIECEMVWAVVKDLIC